MKMRKRNILKAFWTHKDKAYTFPLLDGRTLRYYLYMV